MWPTFNGKTQRSVVLETFSVATQKLSIALASSLSFGCSLSLILAADRKQGSVMWLTGVFLTQNIAGGWIVILLENREKENQRLCIYCWLKSFDFTKTDCKSSQPDYLSGYDRSTDATVPPGGALWQHARSMDGGFYFFVVLASFPLSPSKMEQLGELDRWWGENDREYKGHSTWRWARAVSHGGIWWWREVGGERVTVHQQPC